MIEASWGGAQYPNGSTIAEGNWISSYALQCPMTGCLFDLKHDHTEQHEVMQITMAGIEEAGRTKGWMVEDPPRLNEFL